MSLSLFGLSFAAALLGTWFSMWVARRWGIMDIPGVLKPHARPTPRFGGLGIAFGLLAAFLVVAATTTGHWPDLIAIGLATGISAVTGALDDIWQLSPWQKLSGQLLAGLCMAFFAVLMRPTPWTILAAFAGVIFIALMANAVNLLDGMDGLAGGTGLIMASGFWLLGWLWGDSVTQFVAVGLAGGCAGFLFFNIPPARTFMGDLGSLLIGTCLASLTVRLALLDGDPTRGLVALAILAVPLYDTSLGILRRWIHSAPLFAGDREHIYDQWFRRTDSRWLTLITSWGLAVLVASAGIATALHHWHWRLGMSAVVLVSLVGLTIQQGFLFPKGK